jgi:hypothetical protein
MKDTQGHPYWSAQPDGDLPYFWDADCDASLSSSVRSYCLKEEPEPDRSTV